MPVPAFRNSRSRVRRRRSHHALKPIQLLKDKVTGELKRHHYASEEVVVPVAPKKAPKAKKKAVKATEANTEETKAPETSAE